MMKNKTIKYLCLCLPCWKEDWTDLSLINTDLLIQICLLNEKMLGLNVYKADPEDQQ